jgi:membrane-bound ClpP family serine protease
MFSFMWLWGGIGVFLLAVLFLVVWMAKEYFSLKGHFAVTDNLIGQIGTVKVECSPTKRGKVYVAGAYWDAVSESGVLPLDSDIEVVRSEEKFLIVRAKKLI